MNRPALSIRRPALPALVAATAGSAALMIRPNVALSLVTVALVGAAGALGSNEAGRTDRTRAGTWMVVVAAGCLVFYAGKELGPPVGVRTGGLGVFAVTFTAVAEEAFFRGFAYGLLSRRGAVPAIAITTVVFALIHVPAYGVAVLPIDVAAGALLGWQRFAAGTWTAPAATHLAANLMMLG